MRALRPSSMFARWWLALVSVLGIGGGALLYALTRIIRLFDKLGHHDLSATEIVLCCIPVVLGAGGLAAAIALPRLARASLVGLGLLATATCVLAVPIWWGAALGGLTALIGLAARPAGR